MVVHESAYIISTTIYMSIQRYISATRYADMTLSFKFFVQLLHIITHALDRVHDLSLRQARLSFMPFISQAIGFGFLVLVVCHFATLL